jgi:hypothetical protein
MGYPLRPLKKRCAFKHLPAFSKTAEMAGHTAFFMADSLTAVRTDFSKEALAVFTMLF